MSDICAYTVPETTVVTTDQWGIPSVAVIGEVDMACEADIRAALGAQLDRQPTGLVVDLTRVEFFGSTGIRLLVEVYTRAQEQGTALAVATGQRAVLRTLEMTLVDELFDVHPTVAHALTALRGAGFPVPRHSGTHL